MDTVSVAQSGPPLVVIQTRSKIFILPTNESTSRLSTVARIIGTITNTSLLHQPQLSSSAASITSEGSECSAASSTTMLKPVHIQVVMTISAGSAVPGLPSQAL